MQMQEWQNADVAIDRKVARWKQEVEEPQRETRWNQYMLGFHQYEKKRKEDMDRSGKMTQNR